MTFEATLADTAILTAYTEGYIATSEETLPCPYDIGSREFDLWALGHIHRRLLGTTVPNHIDSCGRRGSDYDDDAERLPPCL